MGRVLLDDRADNGAVARPWMPLSCWAQKRSYGGSLIAQYVGCAKAPRRGHLTCHWHQHLEAQAQALKNKSQGQLDVE